MLSEATRSWIQEKNAFLSKLVVFDNIARAKDNSNEYSNAVKSCEVVTKNLQDMSRELENISQITCPGDLPHKLKELEEEKGEIEGQLLERSAFLQEMTEEWDQCEKKIRDIQLWQEKSLTKLDSPQTKSKPLREQVVIREKIIGDISINITKMTMSLEKLEVHFKASKAFFNCADHEIVQVTATAAQLKTKLCELHKCLKEQLFDLESTLNQVDQYQQEILQLKQEIVQVEQQMRSVLSPTYLPQNRRRADQEMNSCQESMKKLHKKMNERTDQVKQLLQMRPADLQLQ